MDVVRPPPVGVAPWIGARLDADEAIAPLLVGEAAPGAEKIGIERRVVLVGLVRVAAGRVRLPDLDERLGHGAAALVQHTAGHDDALPEGLPVLHPGAG